MSKNFSVKTSTSGWQPSISFWVTAALWLVLLIPFLISGDFAVWLVLFALFVILTAIYSLVFGRKSWLGLPGRKGAGGAVGAGVAVMLAGGMIGGTAAPEPGTAAPLADIRSTASASATPSATPSATATATASERLVLLAACLDDGESVKQGSETMVCTLDDTGVLVWMKEKDSTTLLETRAETKRVADEKAVADAAAQKAADEAWAAEQQAEADRVAAQKIADDAAWVAAQQAEAARVAAEQEALRQAPPPPVQGFVEAPGGAVYYKNCDAVRAAGAAPLLAGQPGFRPKLDGNSNGVACE